MDQGLNNNVQNVGITCPNCGSQKMSIQVVNEAQLKNAHHGILWWICIGLWWVAFKWLVLTLPALIFKIFGIGKRKKIVNKQKKIAVCQQCGNTIEIK